MAISGADGTIKIKAGIDSSGVSSGVKGIEKSVGGMGSSLKKLGAIAAAAFSVQKIQQFASECSKAYQEQMTQEAKLTTIMKQRMGATQDEIDSVKALASEQQKLGVIGDEVQLAGAQQVSTFLNESDSIKTLLPAMNNLLAQQKGVNATSSDAVNIGNLMGKVLQGQTSALKRVGISFTEAQEEVLKYGTESEKCAMLSQVITDNVGNMNSVLAQTSAGKQQQLANTWGDVKEQFGEAFTQISTLFIPILSKLASMLSGLAEKAKGLAKGIASIFGGEILDDTKAVATATEETLDTSEEIVDTEKETTKEKKKQLFSFDEINALSDNTKDNEEDTSSASSVSTDTSGINSTTSALDKASESATNFGDTMKSALKNVSKWLGISGKDVKTWIKGFKFDGVKHAFSSTWDTIKGGFSKWWAKDGASIGERLGGIFKSVGNGAQQFQNGFDNVLDYIGTAIDNHRPEIEHAIGTLAGGWTNLKLTIGEVWSQAFEDMGTIFNTWTEEQGPAIIETFDNLIGNLTELGELIGHVWDGFANTIGSWWEDSGREAWDNICKAVLGIGEVIMNLWNTILSPFFSYIMGTCKKFWDEHLQPLVRSVLDWLSSLGNMFATLWNKILKPVVMKIINVVGPPLLNFFKKIWDVVVATFTPIVDWLKTVFSTFATIFNAFTKLFNGDMQGFFDGIWDATSNLFYGIVKLFANIGNLFIAVLNKIIGGVVAAINASINALNMMPGVNIPNIDISIPSIDVSQIGKKDSKPKSTKVNSTSETPPSAKLPTANINTSTTGISLDDIPYLAQGGVIPPNREFLAVLGDQKSGTNIEAPLSTIQDAVRSVLAEGFGGDWTIQIVDEDGRITGEKIVTALERYRKKTGKSIITMGV